MTSDTILAGRTTPAESRYELADPRRTMAQELHDQVVQGLVALNYNLTLLRRQAPESCDGSVRGLQGEVRKIIDEVRTICGQLRRTESAPPTLAAALRQAVERAAQWSPTVYRFALDGVEPEPMRATLVAELQRIVLELLLNAHKHARARQVEVLLSVRAGSIELCVRDDGAGFVVPLKLDSYCDGGHFGLLGVQERVSALGGSLTIIAAPDQGTRVSVCVPL